MTNPDRIQIEPPLRSLAALCVASDEVLVCPGDQKRPIFQVTLEKDGGLYSFNLAGGPVDVLLNNETNSCRLRN